MNKWITGLLVALVWASSASAAELIEVREPVPDSYIVVLKDDVSLGLNLPLVGGLVDGLVKTVGGTLNATFDTVLKGFSVEVSANQLGGLLNDPRVAYVEQNAVVRTQQTRQADPGWGLDRIDQRALPLDGEFEYANAGAGAHLYIIDSGLRRDHREFAGRVGRGFSTVRDNRGTGDCGGHGTAVASAAAGTTHGVAKRATIHPVRVVSCEGFSTSADIIAGIEWIVNNMENPAVVNISLGSVSSRSTLQAIVAASIEGAFFVVAAGNHNADACGFSPANSDAALTVGASTREDARAGFSNHGACVDLFAPGQQIDVAGVASDRASVRLSGTSLAAPFAAGVAASYRAINSDVPPNGVLAAMLRNASAGQLRGIDPASPNRILYSSLAPKPARPAPPPTSEPDAQPEPPAENAEAAEQSPPPAKRRGVCNLLLLGGLCQ